jgi:hypothetical protein
LTGRNGLKCILMVCLISKCTKGIVAQGSLCSVYQISKHSCIYCCIKHDDLALLKVTTHSYIIASMESTKRSLMAVSMFRMSYFNIILFGTMEKFKAFHFISLTQ